MSERILGLQRGSVTGAATLTLAAVAYGNLIGLMPEDLRDSWYVPLNLTAGLGIGAVALWWLRLDAQGLGLAQADTVLQIVPRTKAIPQYNLRLD